MNCINLFVEFKSLSFLSNPLIPKMFEIFEKIFERCVPKTFKRPFLFYTKTYFIPRDLFYIHTFIFQLKFSSVLFNIQFLILFSTFFNVHCLFVRNKTGIYV